MSSRLLTALAGLSLMCAFWLFSITDRPGSQILAAFGMGVAIGCTVSLTVKAAKAAVAEREKVSR